MDEFDNEHSRGRKGIAYDWQGLYAQSQADTLDQEIAMFRLEYVE
jgi:hypothetical protein